MGLKKVEVSKKTGLSLGYVGRLEAGKRRPSRATLTAWAGVTGVPLRWLETGKGERRPLRPLTARETLPAYAIEPTTWAEALGCYLAGTPLERSLSEAALSVGTDWDATWQDMPEPVKKRIRKTLTKLGQAAALVIDGLDQETAEAIRSEFTDLLNRYIAKAFRLY